MEFTLWISPVLSAAHPSSIGRTMITLGPPLTSCLPGKPIGRGDTPQLPSVTHTPGIGTLFSSRIRLGHPSFKVANAHGTVTHTPLQSSNTCHIMRCHALVTPSPTLPLPTAGHKHLPWGHRWPSPGATPSLTQAPALPHALPPPSSLTPLFLAPHPLVSCALHPAVHLPLLVISPPLLPPFTASKDSVWKRKLFFTTSVTNSELWETCTTWWLPWTFPTHGLTNS